MLRPASYTPMKGRKTYRQPSRSDDEQPEELPIGFQAMIPSGFRVGIRKAGSGVLAPSGMSMTIRLLHLCRF